MISDLPGTADCDYVAIDGADHGLCWTYAEEVNAHLVPFLS